MGLFSFGSKEKPKAPPKREAKPDTMVSLALQENLGDADLDYLLEAYAPRAWKRLNSINDNTNTLLEAITVLLENVSHRNDQKKLISQLDTITSRLDDISRRLDALEQSKEITERTR